MKHQALFYQKNNEKIFKTMVCCSRDWCFKGQRCGLDEQCENALEHASMSPDKLKLFK